MSRTILFGKCVKCDEEYEMNCSVNSCFTKEKKCKKCADGYFLKDNTCQQCHALNENNCEAGSCSRTEEMFLM